MIDITGFNNTYSNNLEIQTITVQECKGIIDYMQFEAVITKLIPIYIVVVLYAAQLLILAFYKGKYKEVIIGSITVINIIILVIWTLKITQGG